MSINDIELIFSILNKQNNLSSFRCTIADLNEFLFANALNDQEIRLSVTRLVYSHEELVGFFSLANGAIKSNLIDPDDGEEEYDYSYYPALKIVRLATHKDFERLGIGKAMLQRTIAIALNLSKYSGCRFITVDAKRESIGFYLKYGFKMPLSIVKSGRDRDVFPMYKDMNKIF